jgi:hypothetical protein
VLRMVFDTAALRNFQTASKPSVVSFFPYCIETQSRNDATAEKSCSLMLQSSDRALLLLELSKAGHSPALVLLYCWQPDNWRDEFPVSTFAPRDTNRIRRLSTPVLTDELI